MLITKAPYYMIALLNAYAVGQPEISEHVAKELETDGLIERGHDNEWRATAKGSMYARLLGEVPLPEQKWVDPRLKP